MHWREREDREKAGGGASQEEGTSVKDAMGKSAPTRRNRSGRAGILSPLVTALSLKLKQFQGYRGI